MRRVVEPEWLDELLPTDPRAIRSRRDLRRINGLLGNASIVARALGSTGFQDWGSYLIDLGGGDGHFLLKVAKRFRGKPKQALLLDRQPSPDSTTLRELAARGWPTEVQVTDVFDGLQVAHRNSAVIANLFLHHFEDSRLREMFELIRKTECGVFVACEPSRSRLALFACRCLRVVGCNAVTRHDALVSVRAGFRGSELTALWGNSSDWRVEEGRAGLFSHRFVCMKNK